MSLAQNSISSLQPDTAEELITRIASLTHTLRESILELGLDRHIERAAKQIPDARERLGYVAAMTERAAERALNAIDVAQPIQSDVADGAKALDARWEQVGSDPSVQAELIADTRQFLRQTPAACMQINRQLTEIMMAQDFQDLTGQVIKKLMEVVRDLEMQLVQVLLDNVPIEKRPQAEPEKTGLLNGPQFKQELAPDAVSGQDQVDDLLANLGF